MTIGTEGRRLPSTYHVILVHATGSDHVPGEENVKAGSAPLIMLKLSVTMIHVVKCCTSNVHSDPFHCALSQHLSMSSR